MTEEIIWTNPEPFLQKKKGGSSDIQSIYFMIGDGENQWKEQDAVEWMNQHWDKNEDYAPTKAVRKIAKNGNIQISFRIREPEEFDRFVTLIKGRGIHFIIGYYKSRQ